MKHHLKIMVSVIIASSVIVGCYTQIMTPQEIVEKQSEKTVTHADASMSLNYNQNCYSCHSQIELDDRYVDWKYYGITTAHNGVSVDPMAWNNQYSSPIYEPDPYGWYNPVVPSQPWWLPAPAVIVTSPASTAQPASSGSQGRARTDGSTRDKRGENPRSEPIPAQSQTQQPASSNSTPPSTPSSAVTTSTPQPANTPNSNERPRSDSSTSSTNRTRDDGSTRSGGGRSR